jgi:hypothetical protein
MPKFVIKYTYPKTPGQKRASVSQQTVEFPTEVSRAVENLLNNGITKITINRTE